MQNSQGDHFSVTSDIRASAGFPIFVFRFSIFVFLLLAACGSPGDPQPPRPPVPAAVTDLAARQFGDGAVLLFTLPAETTEGDPLSAPPDVEIFRAFFAARPGAAPQPPPLALVYTIPSAVVDTYVAEGRLRFLDPIKPEEIAKHSGEQLLYLVRTRASKRVASADSNRVSVRVFPVPEPVRDLAATLTESAVELRWTSPARTTAGAPISALAGFRVYRAEVEPAAADSAKADPSTAKLKSPLELLGVSPSASFRDVRFDFDHTYLYVIRSVAQYDLDSVESADSAPLVLTLRDIFPPAPPKDLVVVFVAASPDTSAHFDLSWGISPEPDVAGYHVYRSDTPATSGTRLNPDLLLSPTFRDMSVSAGRAYTYSVTAVDRAGNESPRSAPVPAAVPETSSKAGAHP
jgi:hypothetical protein